MQLVEFINGRMVQHGQDSFIISGGGWWISG